MIGDQDVCSSDRRHASEELEWLNGVKRECAAMANETGTCWVDGERLSGQRGG